jgi:hypothetical protein
MSAEELVRYLRAELALRRLLERLKEQTKPAKGPVDWIEEEVSRA